MKKFIAAVFYTSIVCWPTVGCHRQGLTASPADGLTRRPVPLKVVSRRTADGVTVATLSNGLTAIVRENHNLPVVTVQAFVRAGSLYEGQWLGCGLSHLTEHLVAKGVTRSEGHIQSPKQSRSRLDAIGAESNAYTSQAQTVYYVNCASSRTEQAIDILADWMARPDITLADFQREHGVVQREIEMGMDEANRQMHYAHASNFYGQHPAGVPTIGYLGAVKRISYGDVLDYHSQMYVPQKMIFAVVGDVDVDQILTWLCGALAGFEETASPPHILPDVPMITGVRRVVKTSEVVKDVNERISFRSIPLVHPDLYALDVLSHVLTNGPSSRLYRLLLREKKLVTSIYSGSWTPQWGPGQFTFSFHSAADGADAAEAELLTQLQRVIDDGITAEELDKAKRQKVADYVYSQQSVESQAATLAGDYISAGDVEFSRRYTDRIQAVTAEQVQEMARKYFTFDAMVIT
ncbi:MAG: insulinase family protein, partial [Planctomycetes bacterium]|nr:insulinase family protein [Planctomycetota bacterium]